MIDVIFYLMGLAVWFYLGMQYERCRILRMISSGLEDDIGETVEEELSSEYMNIRLEMQDDIIFAYREEDSLYLTHNTNADELLFTLRAKFPDAKFSADPDSVDLLLKKTNNVSF